MEYFDPYWYGKWIGLFCCICCWVGGVEVIQRLGSRLLTHHWYPLYTLFVGLFSYQSILHCSKTPTKMINFNSTTLGQFLILLTIISYYSISVVDAFAAPSTKLDPVTYLRTEWVSFLLQWQIYVHVYVSYCKICLLIVFFSCSFLTIYYRFRQHYVQIKLRSVQIRCYNLA